MYSISDIMFSYELPDSVMLELPDEAFSLEVLRKEFLKVIQRTDATDFSDKFNYIYTSYLLYAFSLISLLLNYLLKPISCYIATDSGGANIETYLKYHCWVDGIIPAEVIDADPVLHGRTENFQNIFGSGNQTQWDCLKAYRVNFYQWIPVILFLFGFQFHMPNIIWNCIIMRYSPCLNLLRTSTRPMRQFHPPTINPQYFTYGLADNNRYTERLEEEISFSIEQNFQTGLANSYYCKRKSMMNMKRLRLASWYLLIKFIYMLTSVFQVIFNLYLLNVKRPKDIVTCYMENKKHFCPENAFPAIGYCIAELAQLSGYNRIIGQCVFPLNNYNEKMFLFTSTWMVLTFLITVISLPVWFERIFSKSYTKDTINSCLVLAKNHNHSFSGKETEILLKSFIQHMTRSDIAFILRIIDVSYHPDLSNRITQKLWEIYLANQANHFGGKNFNEKTIKNNDNNKFEKKENII